MITLSLFQYDNMTRAANGDSIVFAVIEASDKDTPDARKRRETEMVEILELIELGLLKNVSEKFTEQIEVCKLQNHRGYIVVALTDIGLDMFKEDKVIN